MRDEVEKQIRHLQRQAATARRYQALKEQERRLNAELLALRLRELDSGAQVHDATVRARELVMQAELTTQRAAEAAIERERGVHAQRGEALAGVQARYYEVGADISRLEQAIEHTRELRERQRADLTQTAGFPERTGEPHRARRGAARHGARRARPARPAVEPRAAGRGPRRHGAGGSGAHRAGLAAALGGAYPGGRRGRADERGRARPHRAAGEPAAAADRPGQRLAEEHESVAAAHGDAELTQLAHAEESARGRSEALADTLEAAQEQVQRLRAAAQAAERELEEARAAREAVRAELTSLEALQAAALNDHAGETAAWLAQSGLAGRPRLAATLEVEPGWERAVETVLGDYLEAVCVEELEAAAGALEQLNTGRVTLIESPARPAPGRPARWPHGCAARPPCAGSSRRSSPRIRCTRR